MKKKIPFDISYREKIESGEVSVVTRDDRHVDILKWDANSDAPIVCLITFRDGSQSSWDFRTDGKNSENHETTSDLFLLIEDDGLTELEEACKRLIYHWRYSTETDVDKFVQMEAAEILEAARKALRPEFDKELEQAYKNQDDVVYQRGYDAGFAAGSEVDEERLTDKIAQKIAEKIVKDGNPFIPNPVIPNPGSPNPWISPDMPWPPVTVMYGVTPTEFRPATLEPGKDYTYTSASAATLKTKEEEE